MAERTKGQAQEEKMPISLLGIADSSAVLGSFAHGIYTLFLPMLLCSNFENVPVVLGLNVKKTIGTIL